MNVRNKKVNEGGGLILAGMGRICTCDLWFFVESSTHFFWSWIMHVLNRWTPPSEYYEIESDHKSFWSRHIFENLKWSLLLRSISHKYLVSNLKWNVTQCKCELMTYVYSKKGLCQRIKLNDFYTNRGLFFNLNDWNDKMKSF